MFTVNVGHGHRPGSATLSVPRPARTSVPSAPPTKTAASSRLSWPNTVYLLNDE